MANVSPYLRNLSTSTCSKLISLFNSMSSPSFLLARETNPALLHIILEAISNIIEHQQSHNPLLVYAIIRNHTKFQALQRFDLETAQRELQDRRNPRNDKSDSTNTSIEMTTPTTPFSIGGEKDNDDDDQQDEDYDDHDGEPRPLSEKARGKLPEGFTLPRRESTFSLRSATALLSPSVSDTAFRPTAHW